MKSFSHVRLFVTPWTVAYHAPLSMGFSRQEYWSGLPFPSPEDLPDPGIEPRSPEFQADALTSEPPGKPKGTLWLHGLGNESGPPAWQARILNSTNFGDPRTKEQVKPKRVLECRNRRTRPLLSFPLPCYNY